METQEKHVKFTPETSTRLSSSLFSYGQKRPNFPSVVCLKLLHYNAVHMHVVAKYLLTWNYRLGCYSVSTIINHHSAQGVQSFNVSSSICFDTLEVTALTISIEVHLNSQLQWSLIQAKPKIINSFHQMKTINKQQKRTCQQYVLFNHTGAA
jgi:hypothetical protein